MTPEQIREARYPGVGPYPEGVQYLLDEIRSLNAELIEARLSAEEAWGAYDKAIEREKRAKADAWDDGYQCGSPIQWPTPNPHREGGTP